MRITNIAIMPE